MESNWAMRYLFGDCCLDTARYELHRAGVRIPLRSKVFHLLAYLITHRDRVVLKDELIAHLWPEQFVGDTVLKSCILTARKAVGDAGRAQRVIQTLHGRGYRFVAEIRTDDPALTDSTGPASPHVSAPLAPGSAMETHPATATPLSTPRPAEHEHKQVTVLCGHLADALTLATRLDPEIMHALMYEVFALAEASVQRYEGTMMQYTGEGFMALFGAPVAQEDHARRAVLAALELQQRLRAQRPTTALPQDVALDACLGVHTGPVVVGPLQGDPQRLYTAVGATTHLATRLPHLAAPGTVVLSDATYQLVRHEVQSEAVGSMVETETAAAIAVYTVRGLTRRRAGVAGRGARSLSRFVGRTQELAVLHERLAHAAQGQGQVVGIIGEPGMGKSRLLYEFAQSLSGHAVTYREGHCFAYGSATPYLPVRDLLRQSCGMREVDGPEDITKKVHAYVQQAGVTSTEEASLLLQLLDVPIQTASIAQLSPQAQRSRTFALLWQVFLHDSGRQPLVLAVENAHWIDATSEEWLTTLVERLPHAAMLLLVTYRPGYRPSWLEQSVVTQVALPRLLSHESLTVVQSVAQMRPIPDHLTQTIVAKASGNPFFLEELAWAVREGWDRPAAVPIPDTVQAVLAARVDRLPPAEKHLLQAAAVIGPEVSGPLLQAITAVPAESLAGSLRHLQAAEFLYETRLVPEQTYTFKHALTQEVAYQSLLHSTRQHVHRQIAQVLEKQFPVTVETEPALLARHYTEAGLSAQAIPYWQRAGQRAMERSANAEAISHFTQALALLTTLPQTAARTAQELTLHLALAVPLIATKGYASPEVQHAYLRAQELCQHVQEHALRFLALRGIWNCHLVWAELRTAQARGEQLMDLARCAPSSALLVEGHRALGTTSLFLGELTAARRDLEHGIALYDPQQHRALALRYGADSGIVCQLYAGWVLWLLGYPEQARRTIADALTQARALGHVFTLAFALNHTALVCMFRREAQQAQERAEASIAFATEQRIAQWLAQGTVLRGWALSAQGQTVEGRQQICQGMAAWRATGAELTRPWYLAQLAEAYGQAGQGQAGLAVLHEALPLVHTTEERWWEAELHRLQGELLLACSAEPAAEAAACYQHALAIARRQQARSLELRAAMSLSRLWQRQGQRAAAYQVLADVYQWFTEGFETADLKAARALLKECAQ
jgi:class 3 adenylate cyclase/predicted ATPase